MVRLLPITFLVASAAISLSARQSNVPSIEELERALAAADARQIGAIEHQLLSGSPSLNVLLAAGALFAQRSLLRDSAALFERCTELYPVSFEARYNLALARLALGDNEGALVALSQAHPSSDADQIATEYLQGKIEAANGDLQKARTHLEHAYRSRPDEENYALDLALLYIRSAAYVPAMDVLQTASVHHPESAEIELELALADVLAGRSSAAIALCRKLQATEIDASLPVLITTFALCTTNNYQACRNEAELGMRAPHAHPYLSYLHATALWNLSPQDHEALLADLNAAVLKLPNCGVCVQLRSRVFEDMRNDEAAIADLKRVVSLEPRSAPAWYRLSVLYKKNGQPDDRAEALRRYHALQTEQVDQEMESFRSQFLRATDSLSNAPSR